MTDHTTGKKLAGLLQAAARDIQPARDLWPGIAHELQAPTRHRDHQAALAASVLLVLALSLYYGARQPLPALPDAGQGAGLDTWLETLSTEHRLGKEALLVQYEGREAWYPDWEVQMKQLEQAEQAVYQALQQDPANLELLKILRQVQNRQMQLIDNVFDPHLNTI